MKEIFHRLKLEKLTRKNQRYLMGNKTKPWYTSRTVLAGVSAVAFALYAYLESGLDLRSAALGAFGVLVVYLRAVTDKRLTK